MTFPDIPIAIAVTVLVGVVWQRAVLADWLCAGVLCLGRHLLDHAPDEHAEQLFIGGTDRFHNGERK